MARSGAQIDVQGLKPLVKDLRQAGDKEALDAIKAGNKAAAEIVAEQSKFEVPERSGKLKASIRAAGTLRAGLVRAGKASVPYAGPIHFGWPRRHIKPQPFIYEAADKRIGEVVEAYAQRIQSVIDGLNVDSPTND